MMFENLTLTPFCSGESQCKNDILGFISPAFGSNQVKYARIMIAHVCFISLALAGSLGRCLTARPNSLMFKQLPGDPANLMHEKTCVS